MSETLDRLDATAIAQKIRTGECSAKEVLEITLNKIAAYNPSLNAIITPLYDQALEAIEDGLPDGPFSGVPFVIKDLVVSVAGIPSTAASKLMIDNIPDVDSEIVARHRRAGLVIVGKTNSSEFGLATATEPDLYGPTKNPWNPKHSPGGSSGGSAAAVAAGIIPMGHATDGGGSIRIPAACCGLFGLKPTKARITAGPEGGEPLAGMAMQHCVSWSVRDSAALLDATAGPLPGDPYYPPAPNGTYLQASKTDPGRLKIAFSTTAPNGAMINEESAKATRDMALLCESLGHEVVEDSPKFDIETVQNGFLLVFQANTMANISRMNGGKLPKEGLIEPLSMAVAERGMAMSATQYIHSLQSLHRQTRNIAKFYEQYDLWLTPTLATPAPLTGYFKSDETDVDKWLEQILGFSPFTFLCNVTGQPAMTIPSGLAKDNLPVGSHFAAPYGAEEMLFSLAGQLERASPWNDQRPSMDWMNNQAN
ncbi:MAG: amidase [Devosiaceae bacterium]|nr:amidase [Devosiaceae bacterium]